MENIQVFLLILQIVIAVVMIFLVLVQKSDGDSLSGIGGGSGGMDGAISARSSANFLTKLTMFLAGAFMLNCLILAVLSSKINQSDSFEIDKIIERQNSSS
jgi:preprotein translocase subunit SecG